MWIWWETRTPPYIYNSGNVGNWDTTYMKNLVGNLDTISSDTHMQDEGQLGHLQKPVDWKGTQTLPDGLDQY